MYSQASREILDRRRSIQACFWFPENCKVHPVDMSFNKLLQLELRHCADLDVAWNVSDSFKFEKVDHLLVSLFF
jgi:hypothetical protein